MGGVSGLGSEPTSHLLSALAFGLIIMMIVQIFGCVSGAHLNPAVTVGAYIYNHVSLLVGLIYVVAQIAGGIVGYGLLIMLTPSQYRDTTPGLCVTKPHSSLSLGQGFGIEFFATMCLMLVCCGVWDPRNAKNTDSIPLRFGFVVGALAMVAGPYTGCSMNPARSLGPAVWNGEFEDHWIYWIAPLAAGAIVPIVYKVLFWRAAPPERRQEELVLSHNKGSV